MAEAVWDERFRRTGFYEIIHRGDQIKYQRPIPVYMTQIIGFGGGPMLEPMDCFLRTDLGSGGASTSSEYAWKKATEVVELGTRLSEILEDWPGGEVAPTPIHNIGFAWPL